MKRLLPRRVAAVAAAVLTALTGALVLSAPAQAAPSTDQAPTKDHYVTVTAVMHTGVLRANGVHPNLAWKSFTWNALSSGDCTMASGATWTLYDDGNANFDGTLGSTDDGDAWLMWTHLKDGNGAELGQLQNSALADPNDPAKFVFNISNEDTQYRWFARGFYSTNLYQYLSGMSMTYHC